VISECNFFSSDHRGGAGGDGAPFRERTGARAWNACTAGEELAPEAVAPPPRRPTCGSERPGIARGRCYFDCLFTQDTSVSSHEVTFFLPPLGHVTLEELMGTDAIVGHKHYAHLNSREYRSCFWDEKGSKERARQRVAELDRRFREKYPGVPGDIPPPECGW